MAAPDEKDGLSPNKGDGKTISNWPDSNEMEAAFAQMEQGIKAFMNTPQYGAYHAAVQKLPVLGARNRSVVLRQNPLATHVASDEIWQKEFQRHIRPGEKGIEIAGYVLHKAGEEQKEKNAAGRPGPEAKGEPAAKNSTRKVLSRVAICVYDISQTEGKPFPEIIPTEFPSARQVAGYPALKKAIEELALFPKHPEAELSAADKKYIMLPGMSEKMTIRGLLHEAAHAALHTENAYNLDTRTKEIEADSLAFVVCSHYRIDTAECCFPYIAAWSSSQELPELRHSLPRIRKSAEELIAAIDVELMKNRTRSEPAGRQKKPAKAMDAAKPGEARKSEKKVSIKEQLAAAQAKAEQNRGTDAAKSSPGKDPER